MGTYYLDIETTGLEPEKDRIITIQYQELNRNNGEPEGRLTILKEWEQQGGGEEERERNMIKRFIENTPVTSSYWFDFVSVGTNLAFEHKFLNRKTTKYNLNTISISDRPMLDIKSLLVIMNRCEFKGSGLDRMTGKKQSGSQIGDWYRSGDYDRIIKYIENETEEFSKFFVWLCKELPILHQKFANERG